MIPNPEPPLFDEPDVKPATALLETVNAGDEAGVAGQAKAQAKRQRDSAEFWQDVLATEDGRREIWQILADAGTFEQRGGVSANGSYDPVLSAFYMGQKALGHHVYARLLAYARDGVVQMLVEHDSTVKQAVPLVAPRKRRQKPQPAT